MNDERNKIILELHSFAKKYEEDALKDYSTNLHQMHKKMDTAKSLRTAANFLDGVCANE
jgi:hypothetical protein